MKKHIIFFKTLILLLLLNEHNVFGQTIQQCQSLYLDASYSNCNNNWGVYFKRPFPVTVSWKLTGPNNYNTIITGVDACFPIYERGNYTLTYTWAGYTETCSYYLYEQPVTFNNPSMPTTSTLDNRALDKTKAVGTIQGSQSVSLTGGATYSIPIALPSGTNGMEPSLSVVYNSQSKAGQMGQGWGISGLSEISRVGEGFMDGVVNVSAAKSTLDNFAMDGERLIKIGNEYKTKNESFASVIPTIVNGNIESFTVEAKGGQKFEYGKTPESRYSANGKHVIWKLTKSIDNFGNYIEYKYINMGNEILLDEIRYTGNGTMLPYNIVKFIYNRKVDESKIYFADVPIKNTFVISSIKVMAEGLTHSTYNFKYGFDNIHTYLTEAELIGADGSKLNSTLFKYGNTPTKELSVNGNAILSHNWQNDMFIGDFDGNGMSDVLLAPYLNNNKGKEHQEFIVECKEEKTLKFKETQQVSLISKTENHTVPDNRPLDFNFMSQDLNGDGIDDIIRAKKSEVSGLPLLGYKFFGTWLNSIDIYESQGNGLFKTPSISHPPPKGCNIITGALPGSGLPDYDNPKNRYFLSGDFDGDSQMDYLTITSDANDFRVFLHFPALNSFDNEILTRAFWGINLIKADDLFALDFDGDGKTDLMERKGNRTEITTFVKKQASGKTIEYELSTISDFDLRDDVQEIRLGEFNGDGKTDLFLITKINNGHFYFSNGSEFIDDAEYIDLDLYKNKLEKNINIADFDGDGLGDICISWKENTGTFSNESRFDVFYNRGNAYFYKKNYSDDTETVKGPTQVGDFNGDGKAEILSATGSGISTFSFFANTTNHLLETVLDGFNRKVSFKYDKATNGTSYTITTTTQNWPINIVKLPMFLVNEITEPNGIGGQNSTTYKYSNATFHRAGLGFLGFGTVTSQNLLTNTLNLNIYALTSNTNSLGLTHYVSYLQKSITAVGIFPSWVTTTTTNDPPELIDLGSNRWWMKSGKVTTSNSYTGATSTEKIIGYDAFGNVTESESNINNGLEIVNTTTKYQQLGNQFLPIENIVSRTRDGQPKYTAKTTRTYGSDGELITEKLFDGSTECWVQTEFLGYTNDFGQAETKQTTGANVTARTSKLTYSANGRFIEKTENAKGQVSDVNEYDKVWGKPKKVTPISGISTETEYDGFGRVKTIKAQPKGTSTITYSWKGANTIPEAPSDYLYEVKTEVPNEATTIEYFDLLERSIRKIVSASATMRGTNSQYIIVTTEYNAKGQAFKTTSPHYNNGPMVETINYFDLQHRITATDVAGVGTSKVAYEPQGNGEMLVQTTGPPSKNNPSGKVSKQITDATGKVIEIIDMTDNGETKVKFTYWSHGGQREVKDGNGVLLSRMEYDDAGRQKLLYEPNSGTSTYKYNAYGELVEQNIAQGGIVWFTYNELGQQMTRNGPEGTTSNDYYPSGSGAFTNALKKVTGFNGNNMEYTYDSYGRTLTSKEIIKGKSYTNTYITTFEYDNNSRVTGMTYPNGFKINKIYDPNGYLKEVTNGSTKIFEGKDLDALGHYKQYTLGNGITTDIDYDKYGYKRSIVAGTIQNMSFDFELASGNLQSRKDNKRNLTENFVYDKLDRLKTITGPSPMDLTYEDNGNIKSKTGLGSKYSYHGTKIHAVSVVQDYPTDLNRGIQNVAYTPYHQASIITEKFNQNGIKRLEKINLEYGADYERRYAIINSTSNHQEYEVYYAGNYEEFKYANGRIVKMCYISGGNGLCAVAIDKGFGDGAELHYTYRDYLGSILAVTDASGNVQLEQSFDAWGRRRSETNWTYVLNARPQNWEFFNRGYTGHEHYDLLTGGVQLINMNARLYDPVNGRMLRWDIVVGSGTQGFNRYSYANNNPLKYTDPTGNMLSFAASMAIGATIGVITNGISNLQNGENFFKGAGKAALMGAVSGVVAAGIGAVGIKDAAAKVLFQAAAHGVFGGYMSSMADGGSFKSGFVSGAMSSLVAGAIGTKGNKFAMILAGGLTGGISAEMAGGNFWAGARQGLITAGLNHAGHVVTESLTQAQYEVIAGLMSADGKTTIIETTTKITVDVNSKGIENALAVQVDQYSVAGSSVATSTASVANINGEMVIDVPSNVTSIPFQIGSKTIEVGGAGTLNVGKAAGVEINGSVAAQSNIQSGGGSFSYRAELHLQQNSGYVNDYKPIYHTSPLVIASQYGNIYTAALKPYVYVKATWTNGTTTTMGYRPPNR